MDAPSPKVFIVVLNYNGKDCLIPCLRSLYTIKYPNFETVVVDNASRDGSLELARRTFGRAHFIVNERNAGFAAGMNVGIKFAMGKGARYIWLLNNDAVVGEDSLRKLVDAAESEGRCALFSPFILTPSGDIWFSSGRIDYLRMRAEHVPPPVTTSHKPYESGFLTGCALFFPRELVEKIGFFDEKYFLYYEDADFSIRARKAGCRTIVVPDSVVVHGERSSENSEKVYWLVRSGLRFFSSHTPWYLRSWMHLYILLRKVKNRWDKKKGKKEAFLVARAYEDFQKRKTS